MPDKSVGTPADPESTKGVRIHNHNGVSPMCMYAAEDDQFNGFHIIYYGSLDIKGPGLIIIKASGVVPEGRITPQDAVDTIQSWDSTPGLQIAHAGRKASISPPSKGDYIEEKSNGWSKNEDVKRADQSFADAAIHADKAVIAVGLIVEGEDAESILQDEKAGFILAGREFLRDSAFVLDAAQALNLAINWPQQYSCAVKSRRNTSKVATVSNSEPMITLPWIKLYIKNMMAINI